MTLQEEQLVYRHVGNYKGWSCVFTGCGTLIMKKGGKELRSYVEEIVRDWIPICWQELKEKIDKEEEYDNEVSIM